MDKVTQDVEASNELGYSRPMRVNMLSKDINLYEAAKKVCAWTKYILYYIKIYTVIELLQYLFLLVLLSAVIICINSVAFYTVNRTVVNYVRHYNNTIPIRFTTLSQVYCCNDATVILYM